MTAKFEVGTRLFHAAKPQDRLICLKSTANKTVVCPEDVRAKSGNYVFSIINTAILSKHEDQSSIDPHLATLVTVKKGDPVRFKGNNDQDDFGIVTKAISTKGYIEVTNRFATIELPLTLAKKETNTFIGDELSKWKITKRESNGFDHDGFALFDYHLSYKGKAALVVEFDDMSDMTHHTNKLKIDGLNAEDALLKACEDEIKRLLPDTWQEHKSLTSDMGCMIQYLNDFSKFMSLADWATRDEY